MNRTVTAQDLTERSQGEPSIIQLCDDTDIPQRAQQTIQRRAMGTYQLRDFFGIPWAGRQRVGNSKPGEHADRLRDSGSHGQLTHGDRRWWLRW
jgi:hypothetical protein